MTSTSENSTGDQTADTDEDAPERPRIEQIRERLAEYNFPWYGAKHGIGVSSDLRWLLARLEEANAVCVAIDGRHPIAVGDRVGALLRTWREGKATP